jgi:hypothetical protein
VFCQSSRRTRFAARYYLKSRFRCLPGREHIHQDGEEWHPRDLQVARWYAPFFVLGYLFSGSTFLFAGLPVTWQVMRGVIFHLLGGITLGTDFWDACLFLALNGCQLVLVFIIFWRERRVGHS